MIEIGTLPDNLEELKALILDKDERIAARDEHITILEEKIRVLKKAIFGSKSERRHLDDEGSKQLHLFNEAEALAEPEVPRKLVVPEHTRQKPKRKPLPPELPRVEIIEDVDDSEKICCGVEMTRIGEEVCEKLDYVPAKLQVIRIIRPKYACEICEGLETEGSTVKIAPPPAQIIPKGIASPGLVAHIAVSKYADALPLYRQEKIFSRYGIELSRSTMSEWMVKAAGCCTPLMDLLYKELLIGPLINVDETPIQVLNEPERENTTKSYMWVFRGGGPDKRVVLFKYSETRSGRIPREVLAGYNGYCQTDGFSGYDALEATNPGIRLVGCFSHARRNFVKVIDARGKAAKNKPGSAEVALDYIGQLYKIEKIARERQLLAEEIVALRKEKAIPVLEKFKAWMDKRIDQTPPKGLLGQALNYAITRWDKLIRYTENGHITPDNNLVENDIRPYAIGRRNWLFAAHPNGAHASATLYSLIVTARACGLDPYQYLRFLFSKIPCETTEDDYRVLMPQNLTSEILSRFLSSLSFT
jgi:transposase